MEWKTKRKSKSPWNAQPKVEQTTYGNKNFVITWIRLGVDKECKEIVSEWEVLSELLRIFEQIQKESEAVSKLR